MRNPVTDQAIRPGYILAAALWFGLLAGLIELSILAYRKFEMGRMVRIGLDAVWMTPLAEVVLLLIPAVPIALAQRRWPAPLLPRVGMGSAAFLACATVLFMFPGLHLLAVVLLAAGVAVQTARLVGKYPLRFRTLIRRTLPGLVAFVILLVGGVMAKRVWAERRALAALPTPASGSPNVLVLILDTVRAASLSLYGYGRLTSPNLDRLAEQGVVFDRAIATSPWTLPSHGSMFTGRWPHQLSTGWTTPLDATYPTLGEALRDQGYATAGFVANLPYGSYEHGLDRGFIHYEDFPTSFGQLVLSSALGRAVTNRGSFRRLIGYHDTLNRKSAEDLGRYFLRWSTRQRRPFFAFLLYFDAHEPYLPPAPWNAQFGPHSRGANIIVRTNDAFHQDRWKLSAAEVEAERNSYDAGIAYIDHEIGRLLEELERRRLLENTLIIVTADHGEQHGEHGLFDHANSLYSQLIHVPLIVVFPGRVPERRRIAAAVSLRELPASVLDLLGLPAASAFPGQPLSQWWRGDPGAPTGAAPETEVLAEVKRARRSDKPIPIAKGDMQAVVMGAHHYIRNGDGREEIYDLRVDAAEEHDLAAGAEGQALLPAFRSQLSRLEAEGQRVPGKPRP